MLTSVVLNEEDKVLTGIGELSYLESHCKPAFYGKMKVGVSLFWTLLLCTFFGGWEIWDFFLGRKMSCILLCTFLYNGIKGEMESK